MCFPDLCELGLSSSGSWISVLILNETCSPETDLFRRKPSYIESCCCELWWGWVGFAEKVWVSLPKLWSKEILVLLNVKSWNSSNINTKKLRTHLFSEFSVTKIALIACQNWMVCVNEESIESLPLIFEYPIITVVTRLCGRRRSVTFWVVA